ncbi:EcoAI/FtnUII family type I restriction enzme subunit R [Salinispora pacifica]|uniref:EcoAI/FtnUII family type I restriction enzme subunit R n=1 Tax=Salinispora pacifica TaxID=351187 RepID=UPI0004B9C1C5|nr:type I restriction endonuclease subunit R [Salinispora pacifica]
MTVSYGMSEDETCRAFVIPALKASGWADEQIRPQFRINDGRLTPTPKRHAQDDPLIADYVLEYTPDVAVAVVEAKRWRIDANDGVEQARRYAAKLGLSFAYATNGHQIVEIDYSGTAPAIRDVDRFPSPDELWARYVTDLQADTEVGRELLEAPYEHGLRNSDNTAKRPRYYQRVAVARTLAAITRGQKRILLVLATGTGKTMVALQTVAKLYRSRWVDGRRPRVLYLSDRSMLVDDPKDRYFLPVFGPDDVHKISGEPVQGRKIYFALYQALEKGDEEELFRRYDADYFDLVIVDECHRGSARDNSQWRRVLEHFAPATQIGMTATPISKKDADNLDYFGDPVYTYSLAEGIEDGYLAPYRVRRVRLNVDMEGYQTVPGQRDRYGNEIPEGIYGPKDFERVMIILERTETAAQYVIDYLRSTAEDGKHGKTIVFCENNDHAARMRKDLFNAASAEVNSRHDYVVRITDADGPHGRALLDEFRKDDSDEPVIAVTSKLLNTGIDLPAVRNIVLFRRIGSMPEFKQTIGRGTRLCPEIGKGSFDIIDFVEATRLFNDPGFDGPPLRVVRDTADEQGHLLESTPEAPDGDEVDPDTVAEPETEYVQEEGGTFDASSPDGVVNDPDEVDRIRSRGRRYVVSGVQVYKWGERRYQLDTDGRTMRLVTIQQWVHDRVLELDLAPDKLRSRWAAARSRREIMTILRKADVEAEGLPAEFGSPDVDPIDLLLNVAWGLPLVSREERLYRFLHEHQEFLDSFQPQARQVLDEMLLKFAEYGSPQLKPETLAVRPFTDLGSVVELAARFGGAQPLHEAIDDLSRRLIEAS